MFRSKFQFVLTGNDGTPRNNSNGNISRRDYWSIRLEMPPFD